MQRLGRRGIEREAERRDTPGTVARTGSWNWTSHFSPNWLFHLIRIATMVGRQATFFSGAPKVTP